MSHLRYLGCTGMDTFRSDGAVNLVRVHIIAVLREDGKTKVRAKKLGLPTWINDWDNPDYILLNGDT